MTDQIDLRLRRFAAWHERFLAYLVDIAPLFVLFLVLAVLTDDADSYLPIGFWFSTDSSSSSPTSPAIISRSEMPTSAPNATTTPSESMSALMS